MMSEQRPTHTGPTCPTCGSTTTIPIVYGYPTGDAMERARRGEFALGGCISSADSPHWACTTCGSRFRSSTSRRQPSSVREDVTG
jgi:transposase-like protein